MPSTLKKAKQLLSALRGTPLTRGDRIRKSLEVAELLLEAAHKGRSHSEKKREAWLARMMADPQGRTFLTYMSDQCFRSHSSQRTADQLVYLLRTYGIPRFLNPIDHLKFTFFRHFGDGSLSNLLIPLIKKQVRHEMAHVLLPDEQKQQVDYFSRCWNENVRINLNHLGEAILGEKEASNRLKVYLSDLSNPLIEYISIKISSIYSQINRVAFRETLETLSERLRLLYRAANNHRFVRPDGSEVTKFVNLDMEEYKDLNLTATLFQKVLSEPEFSQTHAGIVLQSYLPDTFETQKKLTQWAMERQKKGQASIKIRIVKGANLAMEEVESSQRSWELVTYDTKTETDANFKRMLEYASHPERAKAVHIGVASHNVFDIAYALVLRAETETEAYISFEMLQGMATSLQRSVKKLAGSMLLYCPEAKEKDFHTAVAYLIRRLDENCGPENFLSHFFQITKHKSALDEQIQKFVTACSLIDAVSSKRKRNQNRLKTAFKPELISVFENEADTDFSLEENRIWAAEIFSRWETKSLSPIPLVIGGQEMISELVQGSDPSRPGLALYQYSIADISQTEKALECASEHFPQWSALPFSERSALLADVAHVFREMRGELIGAMIADGGKTVEEADPEVSEAIDFLEYYRRIWQEQLNLSDLTWSAKGTILVAPPWNFPCSIPAGGIAAALAAGNCVIFKPAPETALVGWHVAQAFWQGGIPKEVLQFVNCKDEPVGSYLIKHPKIHSVILTGGTETARTFIKMRPGIDLHAETGGKNAIIVTAMSDRDLAVRDIVHSAFGHSGQKCSACSLAILEAEVYEDPNFKQQLLDAASSLKVASAWKKNARITPLIRPPEGALLRALTQLEPHESWLLQPTNLSGNPHLWNPGIKWGVQENSFTHHTELFGPLLGVMRAENLEHAISLANATPYGLTSGLHSLDEREQVLWKENIHAGNLYINRGITGAIVRRQPFGGCKASSFGFGAKAGGPNYVQQFARPQQISLPHEKASLPASLIPMISSLNIMGLNEEEQHVWKASAESYAYWAHILTEPKDVSRILGQHNFFYHIPLEKVFLRAEAHTSALAFAQVVAACLICRVPLEISTSTPLKLPLLPHVEVISEDEDTLISRQPGRLRLLAPASAALQKKAARGIMLLLDRPVLANGRFELLHYMREVSLSHDYHRYGYVGSN